MIAADFGDKVVMSEFDVAAANRADKMGKSQIDEERMEHSEAPSISGPGERTYLA